MSPEHQKILGNLIRSSRELAGSRWEAGSLIDRIGATKQWEVYVCYQLLLGNLITQFVRWWLGCLLLPRLFPYEILLKWYKYKFLVFDKWKKGTLSSLQWCWCDYLVGQGDLVCNYNLPPRFASDGWLRRGVWLAGRDCYIVDRIGIIMKCSRRHF